MQSSSSDANNVSNKGSNSHNSKRMSLSRRSCRVVSQLRSHRAHKGLWLGHLTD